MTTLPTNAQSKAERCDFIPSARRKQILEHLDSLKPVAQSEAIETIIQNGGDEGRFLTVLLGKDDASPKDSPRNKKLGPPETI